MKIQIAKHELDMIIDALEYLRGDYQKLQSIFFTDATERRVVDLFKLIAKLKLERRRNT